MPRAREEKTLINITPHEKKVMQDAAKAIAKAMAGMEPFKAAITEARASVKALGIKMKQFNVAFALWGLETDDRNEAAEGLRKAFEALDLGKTLDFVDVLEAEAGDDAASDARETTSADAEPAEPANAAATRGPVEERAAAPASDHGELAPAAADDEGLDEGGYTYAAGKQAGEQGEPVTANPHQATQPSHAIWARGWKAGDRKRAKAAKTAKTEAQPPALSASAPNYSGMMQ